MAKVMIYIQPRTHIILKQKAELEGKSLSQYLVDKGMADEITLSNLFKKKKRKK